MTIPLGLFVIYTHTFTKITVKLNAKTVYVAFLKNASVSKVKAGMSLLAP